jgi:hypothetical protein
MVCDFYGISCAAHPAQPRFAANLKKGPALFLRFLCRACASTSCAPTYQKRSQAPSFTISIPRRAAHPAQPRFARQVNKKGARLLFCDFVLRVCWLTLLSQDSRAKLIKRELDSFFAISCRACAGAPCSAKIRALTFQKLLTSVVWVSGCVAAGFICSANQRRPRRLGQRSAFKQRCQPITSKYGIE